MSLLSETAIFLGAAVIAVPLSKRLGLGGVLGYLAAGVVIGPQGFGFIEHVEDARHFAEFGVVLLLFIIGLELQPRRLWALRKSVFGMGTVQVLVTGTLLGLAALAAGLGIKTAIIVGLALSLSSTAFALQTLAERKQLTTRYGRSSFAILLFQDLAVIPLLALVPMLAPAGAAQVEAPWVVAGRAGLALAGLVVGGHYVLRYALRLVAATRIHEIFTATALLTVIGSALLMEAVGLSMALGAFLAGVLLADSEYRHALEADIEPFKGLLLGLFFITVGMSVKLDLLAADPGTVLALVAGLVAVKSLVLYGLGRGFGLGSGPARSLAVVLSQGGEFAFVIFGVAVAAEIIAPGLAGLLILVVTLSMAATPLLLALDQRLGSGRSATAERDYDRHFEEENRVIIAGFGRFGQIVARILRAKRIGFTALDASSAQVDFVKRFGSKIYYGDASDLHLLRAAGADKAELFVVTIDDVAASLRTAETVVKNFPHLKVYARARNRKHAYQLMDLGITLLQRSTFLSALDMARMVLEGLGLDAHDSRNAVERFREHDVKRLFEHHHLHNDEEKMRDLAKQAAKELEEMFEQDARAVDRDVI